MEPIRFLMESDTLMALLATNRLMNRGAVAANEHLLSPLRGYAGMRFRTAG